MHSIQTYHRDRLAYDYANRSDEWIVNEYVIALQDEKWGTYANRISAKHHLWYLQDLAILRGLDLDAEFERLWWGRD